MVPAMDLAVALKGLTITGFNVHKYSDKFDAALSQVCLSRGIKNIFIRYCLYERSLKLVPKTVSVDGMVQEW